MTSFKFKCPNCGNMDSIGIYENHLPVKARFSCNECSEKFSKTFR
jgi:transposase-like protein